MRGRYPVYFKRSIYPRIDLIKKLYYFVQYIILDYRKKNVLNVSNLNSVCVKCAMINFRSSYRYTISIELLLIRINIMITSKSEKESEGKKIKELSIELTQKLCFVLYLFY